ncbi:MAG TPA: 1,4-beta-xylanase [Bacteroidales bacterium]|nr:1,4-beta-xylanase [Bacteroidales bacterium]
MKKLPFFFLLGLTVILLSSCSDQGNTKMEKSMNMDVWPVDIAQDWYNDQPWIVGCNFTPSSAINQIEFWQESTFDPETIDREAGYAGGIGFNTFRVYLHYLVWAQNPEKMKQRMNQFLDITSKHGIRVMFVLFDDCWNSDFTLGKQPDPRPGVHNSGWVQCPGGDNKITDMAFRPVLEAYTKDVIQSIKDDKRVLMWDIYNEPGNSGYKNKSLSLLSDAFGWAHSCHPSQPVTAALWNFSTDFTQLDSCQVVNSDIITFHNYSPAKNMVTMIKDLQKYSRPLVCSEYMARTNGSTFRDNLPVLKKYNVGAINWGLVSGKTNTIFPWGSKEGTTEPDLWFHDIFRVDGKPYDTSETRLIKKLTGKNI